MDWIAPICPLAALEVRQQVRKSPPGRPARSPAVIDRLLPAHMRHGVDSARPAQGPAPRIGDSPSRDFRDSANPPVLHRKETFVGPGYPGRGKFARLTEQEKRHGLLADPATIGTRDGWTNRLQDAGWALRGHLLVRQEPVVPANAGRPLQ